MIRVLGLILIVGAVVAFGLAAFRAFVPTEQGEPEKPRFLQVQDTFEEWRNRYDCASMDSGITALKAFLTDQSLLAGEQIQTVTLPKAKISPTIGDLAADRTIRLQMLKKQLCP